MSNATHLTQAQISGLLAGLATSGQLAHVAGCAECREEIARRKLPLEMFRESVQARGERPAARTITWTEPNRWRGMMLRWAAGTALALLFLGVPLMYWNKQVHLREAERLREDAALLDSVNQTLSRSVPESFEPLDKMVAWSPSTDSTSGQVKQ